MTAGISSAWSSLRYFVWMLSGPDAVDGFKLLSSFCKPSFVILMLGIQELVLGQRSIWDVTGFVIGDHGGMV